MRVDRANDLNCILMTPYNGPLPAPGAEAQVSVKMEAPLLPGEYNSYFKMISPSGKKFGQRLRCMIVVAKDGSIEASNIPNPELQKSPTSQ